MSTGAKATNAEKGTASRKRGGNLSGFKPHQGSAAHIGVQPARQHQRLQAEAASSRQVPFSGISVVAHTWVCGQARLLHEKLLAG